MDENRVTFIIASRPGTFPEAVIERIRKLDYPPGLIDVILTQGVCPSHQRNEAARRARGGYIYFLDDDSYIDCGALRNGLKYFNDPGIAAVGGPAVTHDEAKYLENGFGAAMASGFGCGPICARSRPRGPARVVRGEELILCNLLMRRDVFLNYSGLDVRLYPNEENELLKRLRLTGYRFYYVPDMLVRRPHRALARDFARQMFSYGRGRAQHVLRGFSPRDLIFFLPSVFLVYLALLPFSSARWMFLPLVVYAVMAIIAGVRGALRSGRPGLAAVLPFVFPLMHISYGAGFFRGFLRAGLPDAGSPEVFIKEIESAAPRQPEAAPGAEQGTEPGAGQGTGQGFSSCRDDTGSAYMKAQIS